MLIIEEFKKMSKGKQTSDMLPLILALSQKANSMGINFSRQEMEQILASMKSDMSEQDQAKADMLFSMLLPKSR